MPRGFLVKRSKRASGGSYRIRHECAEVQETDPHALKRETPRDLLRAPCTDATAARASHTHVPELSAHALGRSVFHSSILNNNMEDEDEDEDEEAPGAEEARHTSAVHLSAGLKRSPFPRCLSSPAAGESFPVSSIEHLLLSRHADMKLAPYPSSFQQNLKPETKSKPPVRKSKVARKLTFEDEVTTSPVLGLRIKKESPETASVPRSKKPLGEFICQLCKEEYPDPFSLAQHRCSRIVRVEYRCPECDKVFSCPANLASHRRWHKPRDHQDGKKAQVHEKASVEGKENASEIRVKQQHPPHPPHPHHHPHHPHHPPHPHPQLLFFSAESGQSGMPPADTRCGASEKCFDLRASSKDDGARMFERRRDDTDSLAPGYLCARAGEREGAGEEEEEEEEYACHYCPKKFRRHAYLRKHLAAHQSIHAAAYKHAESAPVPFTCHLCGARFPTADVREKHRLWHALAGAGAGKTTGALMRADLMLPPKPSRMWEVPT